MNITKNHMARIIVQALYNLPELPPASDRRVMSLEKRGSVASLTRQLKLAVDALASVAAKGKHAALLVLVLSLGACNSVTTRMTWAEQDRFLFHGLYGDYELPRMKEPVYFQQAERGDYGHGAGE